MENNDEKLIEKINQLLAQNLENEHFGSLNICRELGFSRSNLHRLLKRHTFLSTTIYIRQFRLKRAKQLLVDTSMRISTIAYLVGFACHQNFTKYFHSKYGVSPSQYRKECRIKV